MGIGWGWGRVDTGGYGEDMGVDMDMDMDVDMGGIWEGGFGARIWAEWGENSFYYHTQGRQAENPDTPTKTDARCVQLCDCTYVAPPPGLRSTISCPCTLVSCRVATQSGRYIGKLK